MSLQKGGELLALKSLSKHFKVGTGFMASTRQVVRAVDNVDLSVYKGEVLGLVGESGCGKTTLGRLALRLLPPTSGSIIFKDRDISRLSRSQLRPLRRHMQIIFQDPVTSLNPRLTVGSILAEPLKLHKAAPKNQIPDEVAGLLTKVGLRPDQAGRYPHQFSGGQRQRIGIARALALKPELVVADEPVSALDVSIQAQVMNLLMELKSAFGLTYLFVAHDLSVVKHLSDRIAVMYLGKIVDLAPAADFESAPVHPYTRALLDAAPVADPKRIMQAPPLMGDVASPINPPKGCRFHTRCPEAKEICAVQEPLLKKVTPQRSMACHFR